jgi:hypothetical protein
MGAEAGLRDAALEDDDLFAGAFLAAFLGEDFLAAFLAAFFGEDFLAAFFGAFLATLLADFLDAPFFFAAFLLPPLLAAFFLADFLDALFLAPFLEADFFADFFFDFAIVVL